jgi:RNA 3'-phosphate cyclase
MIHIDGSYMEGGGQIVRTALALSTLTGKPFKIDRIRHHRSRPGLKPQHLSCIDALKQLANAQVKGAQAGSDSVDFFPDRICAVTLSVDIGTAGSITLLLQSLLLPCMFADAPVRIKIKGGTDTRWSIPIDYFSRVILPCFNRLASIEIKNMQRGFYPKGQGFVDLSIVPRFHLNDFTTIEEFAAHLGNSVSAIDLTGKTAPIRIEGISCASSRLKAAGVAKRQAEGAAKLIGSRFALKIDSKYQDTASPGTVITLWTVSKEGQACVGADALGERGVRAEKIGAMAARKLLEVLNSDAAVDPHLADNLIPLLALVGGTIKTNKITEHIRSNIYVCEQFLDVAFSIDENQKRITTGP